MRRKWTADKHNRQKDDIVALLDPTHGINGNEHPRVTWKLARVIEVFPGADGVRSVEVKVALVKETDNRIVTIILHRLVHKMVLVLPADETMSPQACPGPAECTK